MPTSYSQPHCYGWIEVRAANCSGNINTEHNSETPSESDDNPFIHAWDCSRKESKGCHNAITEENQDHRPKKLPGHFTPDAR
jgi:hypothetical protein